jgi:uncharacterized membrane protein
MCERETRKEMRHAVVAAKDWGKLDPGKGDFMKISQLTRSRFLIGAIIMTAIFGAGATQASAVTLRACNHTKDAVLVAGSYIPPGGEKWRNKGWTRVNAGGCQNVFQTTNNTFYVRAEVKGDSSQFWGSDIMQCVEYPGPYDFYTGSDDTTCPEGEPQKFTTIHSDGRPVFVWNLNP